MNHPLLYAEAIKNANGLYEFFRTGGEEYNEVFTDTIAKGRPVVQVEMGIREVFSEPSAGLKRFFKGTISNCALIGYRDRGFLLTHPDETEWILKSLFHFKIYSDPAFGIDIRMPMSLKNISKNNMRTLVDKSIMFIQEDLGVAVPPFDYQTKKKLIL